MADDISAYEKLGVFYLGREYDLGQGTAAARAPLLYDSRDLVTHARLRRHDRQRQDGPLPRRCSKRRRSTASRPSSSIPRATSATCC